jgi:hypothetical protein
MMLREFRTYTEFVNSYEESRPTYWRIGFGSWRLRESSPPKEIRRMGRKLIYLLTARGIDLAPVPTEMVLWAAGHEDTGNQAIVTQIRRDKEQFRARVRQRWAQKTNRSKASPI